MLYDQLLEKKNNGQTITLKGLGYNELYRLYVVEKILDEDIACLCNCDKKSVRNKRHRLKIYASEQTILGLNQHGIEPDELCVRMIKINNNEKV